jgi:phthiocerol/phenolphthiocerol synthesis type-I polyketide synthase D
VSHSAQEIQDWLVSRISSLTGLAPEAIDVDEPYYRHGLDSVTLVLIFTDLETWLGRRVHENPLDEHPTIASLARFLADKTETRP